MTPTEQDEELREKLKEAVLETGRYETIGDEHLEDKYLRRFIDELVLHAKAYTDERVREARVDELENRLRVQFIPSHWARLCAEVNSWAKYVDRRIAELDQKIKELES